MADKKTHRSKRTGEQPFAVTARQSLPDFRVKEYNYVLRILPEHSKLLEAYREQLAAGTAGFAEVYYNFLFDNPDLADVLYSYEKGGGDVGLLVREELESMLASIAGKAGINHEKDRGGTGEALFENHL